MDTRVTQCLRRAYERAKLEMASRSQQMMLREHELLGLIRESGGLAAQTLRGLDVDLNKLRRALERELTARPKDFFSHIGSRSLFFHSRQEQQELGHECFGTLHCLLAALRDEHGLATRLLAEQGVTPEQVREHAARCQDDPSTSDGGGVSVPMPNHSPGGVQEQLERLQTKEFQDSLREMQKYGLPMEMPAQLYGEPSSTLPETPYGPSAEVPAELFDTAAGEQKSGLVHEFLGGVQERLEQLQLEEFQEPLRAVVEQSQQGIEMSPILWNIGDRELKRQAAEAVPALIAALNHQRAEVRCAAAQTLVRFGAEALPAVPRLFELLRDTELVRAAALRTLARIDPDNPAVIAAIRQSVEDASPLVRISAAHKLWTKGRNIDTVLPIVAQALEDADPRARMGAAALLARMLHTDGNSTANAPALDRLMPLIEKALTRPDFEVIQQLLPVLQRLPATAESVLPLLLQALRQRERLSPPWFARTMPEAWSRFQQLSEQALTNSLVSVAPSAPTRLPDLITALADGDVVVRRAAAGALVAVGPAATKAVAMLEPLLTDADAMLRLKAAHALWNIERRRDAIDTIMEMVTQPGEAATAAAAVLAEMGPEANSAFPQLLHVAATQTGPVRPGAALALFKMGLEQEAVLPVLQQSLQSDNVEEKTTALGALSQLGAEGIKTLVENSVNPFLELNYPTLDVSGAEAIALWTEAIRNDPADAQAYLLRGLVHFQNEAYNEAIADYTAGLQHDPCDAAIFSDRAEALVKKNDFRAAVADYTQAITLNPNDSTDYSNRSFCHMRLSDLDAAIADADTALRLNPVNVYALNNRAISFKRKGAYERALADYTQAITLDPLNGRYYLNRSLTYSKMKNHRQALADLERARHLRPESATTLGQIAWVLATADDSVRDVSKALVLAQQACERSSWNDGGIIDTLATAHAANGNFEEASRLIDRAVELSASLPEETQREILTHQELFRQHRTVDG